jgi:hypothetical protein
MNRRILLFLLAATTTVIARAEDIPCADLQVRVTKQTLYPPIAMAAHVSGKIELDLRVSSDAKILSIENISGSQMLQGAARDYVSSWDLSWQGDKKHHVCVEKVFVDFKLLEPTKSVSSYSYEIVTEDGTSTTTVIDRPPYYKPTILY